MQGPNTSYTFGEFATYVLWVLRTEVAKDWVHAVAIKSNGALDEEIPRESVPARTTDFFINFLTPLWDFVRNRNDPLYSNSIQKVVQKGGEMSP